MGHCGRKIFESVGFCENSINIKLFWSSCFLIHHEGETLLSLEEKMVIRSILSWQIGSNRSVS
jgi:hypothetical protein